MLLQARKQLVAVLLVSLVAFSSVSLAKSVDLISDFVSGRPLERSARFRWVAKRDNESPMRHEASLDEAGQIYASRWEPRTLAPQQVPQVAELQKPPRQQQQQSQLEHTADMPGGQLTEDGDNIEESFDVSERETSEEAPRAASVETELAQASAPVSGTNQTVQEASQTVSTGALQKEPHNLGGSLEHATQQEATLGAANLVANQTTNQTIHQTTDQAQTQLNATHTNVTSQAPEVQIVSTTQNLTTALNANHASGSPKNEAQEASDIPLKIEAEEAVSTRTPVGPVEAGSSEANTLNEPPTSKSADEAKQVGRTKPSVNPQEHFGRASQVSSEMGGVASQSGALKGTEGRKSEISSMQSAVESVAQEQNRAQTKQEEQTEPNRSSGTKGARVESEPQAPQDSSRASSRDVSPTPPQEAALNSSTEVPPQDVARTGSPEAGPGTDLGHVQVAPSQEAAGSNPQQVSPELHVEGPREQSAPASSDGAPPSDSHGDQSSVAHDNAPIPVQKEHFKPEQVVAGPAEKSVDREASNEASEEAQATAAGGQKHGELSPSKELATEQLQFTPANDNSPLGSPVSANSTSQYRQEQIAEEMHLTYQLDAESCPNVPSAELKQKIQLILDTLASENCSSVLGSRELKLRPAANGRIVGHVMEVSSMPLDLRQMLLIESTRVSCLEGSSGAKLLLYFEHELSDQWLVSRWRLRSKLRLDELPVEMLRSSSGPSATRGRHFKKSVSSSGGKCEKFKLETGEFYLELMAFKLGATYELASNSQQTGAQASRRATSETGGEPAPELHDKRSVQAESGVSVRLIELRPVQLFLEHGLKLEADLAAGSNSSTLRPQQTAQILHSRNDHYRRNNWLLDLYGNWLKHEYRAQLAQLFGPRATGAAGQQLAGCFQ